MRNNRGYMNLQAVQVLNSVEYDINGNPIGLKEGQSEPSSCNFGIDRLPRKGGCYKGDGTVYLSVLGILATDTFTKYEGSGDITILNDRIDIASGIYAYGISIFRNGTLWAFYKMEENYGNILYDSSGNANHGTIVNGITVTPEVNPNSIHQYQNIKSWCNDEGYNLVSGVYIPKNDSVVNPPFKDVLGNDLEFFGKVPGRAKFVDSNCFQQQVSTCYMTVTGLLATDTVTVFGSSSTPTLSAGRMDFIVGSKYYGISIFRSAVLWAYYPMCESIINPSGHIYHDCSGNGNHATLINGVVGNEGKQNEFHYLQKYGFSKTYTYFDGIQNGAGRFTVIPQTDINIRIECTGAGGYIFDSNRIGQGLDYLLHDGTTFTYSGTSGLTITENGVIVTNPSGYPSFHSYIFTGIILKAGVTYIFSPMCRYGQNASAGAWETLKMIDTTNNKILFDLDTFGSKKEILSGYTQNSVPGFNNESLIYIQDGKSFLPSGCFLRQYQQPALIQADKTSGVWFDANAEPYDVAYETLTLQDPINEQIFIGNKDKTKKLGPISTHKVGLTAVQKRTERVVRNVVDDALLEDPAFSHDVTVAAGDLTYSLYNAAGYTMNGIIDWGDGTTQSVNTTTTQTITKTYSAAGTYTVRFTGTMAYFYPRYINTTVNSYKVTKINNWGNVGFKKLCLFDCKIINIPDGPITGLSQSNLLIFDLFRNCGSLVGSIPIDLLYYANACIDVSNLFYFCSGLTGQIPENLFRYCPNLTSVGSALQGCSGLTGQIPENLFRYNVNLNNANRLFTSCSNLTGAIPAKLFYYNTSLGYISGGFGLCSKLSGQIPNTLFLNNLNLVVVNGLFGGCSSLSGNIPYDLFYNCPNLVNTGIDGTSGGVFQGCTGLTGSIPSNLLINNNKITSVQSMFQGCTGLTGAIPNLFATNTLITTYISTFQSCTGLTSIPTDLFRYSGTSTTSFYSTFYGCTGITSIPTGLFDYNTNVTTFANTFQNTRITTIPSNLFTNNTKVTSFSYTFAANPSLAAIPSNLFDTNVLTTTFDNVFNGCTGITSIPTDLFRYNGAVTNMSGVFQGTRITSVPLNLFRYNTEVTSFANVFYALGTPISLTFDVDIFRYNDKVTTMTGLFALTGVVQLYTDMFKYNVNVTSFNNLCSGCRIYNGGIPSGLFTFNTKVTDFSFVFTATVGVTSIPSNLFDTNTLVTNFGGLFQATIGFTSIPADLFRYNTAVVNFASCFYLASSLTILPEDLFYYNTLVTQYGSTFNGTRNLILPTRLFNTANLGKVTTWTNFLNVTSTTYSPTGTVQKIWSTTEGGDVTYTVQPIKTDAFNNCTALSNYAEIPVAYI